METTNADTHEYRRFFCTRCGKYFDCPVSCGNRFCKICSAGRRGRLIRKLNYIVTQVPTKQNYKIRFLTLTIPNQSNIRDGHSILVKSFRRLRQRSFWKKRVDGGAFVIEATGRPGKWHVHLHIILYCKYIPCRMISKYWSKVSPGRIIKIKNVPLSAVVNYLTKYVTKTEIPLEYQEQASEDLSGTRLFQPFGTWHSFCVNAPKLRYQCPNCGCDHFIWGELINIQFSSMVCQRHIPDSSKPP